MDEQYTLEEWMGMLEEAGYKLGEGGNPVSKQKKRLAVMRTISGEEVPSHPEAQARSVGKGRDIQRRFVKGDPYTAPVDVRHDVYKDNDPYTSGLEVDPYKVRTAMRKVGTRSLDKVPLPGTRVGDARLQQMRGAAYNEVPGSQGDPTRNFWTADRAVDWETDMKESYTLEEWMGALEEAGYSLEEGSVEDERKALQQALSQKGDTTPFGKGQGDILNALRRVAAAERAAKKSATPTTEGGNPVSNKDDDVYHSYDPTNTAEPAPLPGSKEHPYAAWLQQRETERGARVRQYDPRNASGTTPPTVADELPKVDMDTVDTRDMVSTDRLSVGKVRTPTINDPNWEKMADRLRQANPSPQVEERYSLEEWMGALEEAGYSLGEYSSEELAAFQNPGQHEKILGQMRTHRLTGAPAPSAAAQRAAYIATHDEDPDAARARWKGYGIESEAYTLEEWMGMLEEAGYSVEEGFGRNLALAAALASGLVGADRLNNPGPSGQNTPPAVTAQAVTPTSGDATDQKIKDIDKDPSGVHPAYARQDSILNVGKDGKGPVLSRDAHGRWIANYLANASGMKESYTLEEWIGMMEEAGVALGNPKGQPKMAAESLNENTVSRLQQLAGIKPTE